MPVSYTHLDVYKRQARGKDLWFHVQKAPGSHVVVMSRGEDIPDSTKQEAAELAVIHSSAYKMCIRDRLDLANMLTVHIDYIKLCHCSFPPYAFTLLARVTKMCIRDRNSACAVLADDLVGDGGDLHGNLVHILLGSSLTLADCLRHFAGLADAVADVARCV